MSGTLIDYLKEYGDCPFTQRPMNDVDSLALCQLSYLKFDGLVPMLRENKRSVALGELSEHADYDRLFSDERFEKENRALFETMVSGRRYRNLKMNSYINLIEMEWETQFSALTFFLEDGTVYIAIRGTDESIVGWKEDFNMAFLSPVPGQVCSVKYLNIVSRSIRKPFYLGGHSKGGNLAVYAAMKCLPSAQDQILKIYSMDGPGFRPEVLKSCGYDRIADRVVKIMPHSSLIGMLFESNTNYQVVESKTFGLAQHDPFTWLVKNGEFCQVDDIYQGSKFLDNTLNEWILSLQEDQLRLFVDTLYQVISASKAEDLIEFTQDWKRNMNLVITALKEVDEGTKKILKGIIKSLFSLTTQRFREGLSSRKQKPKKQNKQEEAHP